MDIVRVGGGPCMTVIVTDADPMTSHLLASDIRRHQLFHVIECRLDLAELLACVAKNSPSILLLSAGLNNLPSNALPLLRAVRQKHPAVKSVVILEPSGPDVVAELFRAGIRGMYLRSEYSAKRLCHCLQCVSAGQVWANSEQLGSVLDAFAEFKPLQVLNARGDELLSPRERDVVRLVAAGYGNREVAQQLGLSVHTIKNYLFNVFDKLGISSRAELVMYVLSASSHIPAPCDRSEQHFPHSVGQSLGSGSTLEYVG